MVLVGHSMGGMAIMALADAHPELFTSDGRKARDGRVAGVVLISTSAGELGGVTLGMPQVLVRFRKPLLPLISGAGWVTADMVDRAREASTDLAWLLTRRYGFGSGRVSPALVSYVERMNSATRTESVARYLRALYTHDRVLALAAFKDIPVLVICGDEDLLTPVEHSEAICEALPHAELVVDSQRRARGAAGAQRGGQRARCCRTSVRSRSVTHRTAHCGRHPRVRAPARRCPARRRPGDPRRPAGGRQDRARPRASGPASGYGARSPRRRSSSPGCTTPTRRGGPGAAGARGRVPARRASAEVDDLDLDASLDDAVTVVEWGEGKVEQLADAHLIVRLDRREDDTRVVALTGVGGDWADRLQDC